MLQKKVEAMILCVSENRTDGIKLASRLTSQGFTALYAKLDAGESLCKAREIGGVIIDARESAQAAQRLCLCLQSLYPELPIAFLQKEGVVGEGLRAQILRVGADPLQEWADLLNFCRFSCDCRQELQTYGLALCGNGEALYMGYPLHLAAREYALLRLLLYRAPRAVPASELLSVCFPEGTQASANLAVQIRNLNRRAAQIDDRFPLVESVYGIGYRLRKGLLRKTLGRG